MHSLSVGGAARVALIRFSALVLISTGYAAALLPSPLLSSPSPPLHSYHPPILEEKGGEHKGEQEEQERWIENAEEQGRAIERKSSGVNWYCFIFIKQYQLTPELLRSIALPCPSAFSIHLSCSSLVYISAVLSNN